MYEQVSHSLLNDILDEIHPQIKGTNLRHFYSRLGANFYAIYTLFHQLYGQRPDFRQKMQQLVVVLANHYTRRTEYLKRLDLRFFFSLETPVILKLRSSQPTRRWN